MPLMTRMSHPITRLCADRPVAQASATLIAATLMLCATLASAQQPPTPPTPAPDADTAPETTPEPSDPPPSTPDRLSVGGPVTPGDDQAQLLRAGSLAYKLGDHAQAIEKFQAALKLGSLNVAHLQLARALLATGRCDEASASLARAMSAPRAIDPPVSQVLQDIAAARKDLAAQCPAVVTVECSPPQMEVFVDGLGPLPCDGQPIMLLPGEHTIEGVAGDLRFSETVTLGLMGRARIKLEPETPPAPPVAVPAPLVTPDPPAPAAALPDLTPEPPPEEDVPQEAPTVVEEKTLKPPKPARRWLLGIHAGAIVGGDATVERETFENFDSQGGAEESSFALQAQAGYQVSRNYNLHFGAKLGLVPSAQLRMDSVEGDEIAPKGTLVDINAFLMYSRPFGNAAFFLSGELGPMIMSVQNTEVLNEGDSFSGFNAAATFGLRYEFRKDTAATLGLRIQGYSLSNEVDLQFDPEGTASVTLSGMRTMLTLGVDFMR